MSISAESTTSGGITDHAAQPTKQYMVHRESTKATEELVGKTFEQVAKLEFENKELRAELEQYQNKQQQTIDDLTEKLKVSIEQLSLKHQEELEKQSNVHKKLMEEMKEQQKMDALQQQKDQNETNDKIDALKKDQQEQFANMSREMEQKQKNGQEELERKMDDSVKSVQAMVDAELNKCQNKQQQTIEELTEKLKVSIEQLSLKQQKDKKETNDKIDSLKKDQQEQFANNIRGMERKMVELLKSVHAIVDAKLQQQKLSNANKFIEIEQKNDKLEKYQKEQQLNIADLQKTVAMLSESGLFRQQNRWNSAACHEDLALIEPERLIVQHNGQKWEFTKMFEFPLLFKGIALFLLNAQFRQGIWAFSIMKSKYSGTHSEFSLDLQPNKCHWTRGLDFTKTLTYAYDYVGFFWGHAHSGNRKEPPKFGDGDVIGCGVNLATRQIIYTKNGERLDTANLFVDSADDNGDLFPCVSLARPGAKIEANFGPNFKFNIAG